MAAYLIRELRRVSSFWHFYFSVQNVLRAYRAAEVLLTKCDASPTEPIEQISDRVLHRVRKIALKPVQQAMRDQTVYVGHAYFKHHASISTLTAIPETRHSNRARTRTPAPFLCTFGRLKIARLLLFQIHAFSPRKDAKIILSILS